MKPSVVATFVFVLAGAVATGAAFSSGQLLAALALPVLVACQRSRSRSYLIALAYFLAAGHDIPDVGGALLWLLAAAIQAMAWGAVCGLPCRTTIASVVSAVLPLGVLSWAHPWHAAGLLFPGTGVFGLVALVFLLEMVAIKPWVLAVVPLIIAGTSDAVPVPRVLRDWAVVETAYGDVFHHADSLGIIEHMTNVTNQHSASVVVWPESMVPSFNEATVAFWPPIAPGKTIIFGGTLNIATAAGAYRNVVLFRGREVVSPVDQRVPVPFAMWRPWSSGGGVPLGFRSPLRTLGGERAAFLICYEQLLVWTYLSLLVDRPTLLVGLSNVHWVRRSSIPSVQTACLRSWAALFQIPFLQAVNR
jgi:hypothetical protein